MSWREATLLSLALTTLPSCAATVGCCEGGTLSKGGVTLPEPAFSFSLGGEKRPVFRFGTAGPPILLMHEIPGLSPETARLARLLSDEGYTVYVPLMFGEPLERSVAGNLFSTGWSDDWYLFAGGSTSPIVSDLRLLVQEIARGHPGEKMGAIGMCLTGAFPLALLSEPVVVAPVVAQPALPLWHWTAARDGSLGLSRVDLEEARERVERDDLQVLGLRFASDTISPPERFASLRRLLGARFEDETIRTCEYVDQGLCIPDDAHATLTEFLSTDPDHPVGARWQVMLAFLRKRLR